MIKPATNQDSQATLETVQPKEPTPEEIKEVQKNLMSNKKCKVCGNPAVMYQSICFMMDTGYGWVVDKVHLCETHAENMTEGEIDQLYVKQRMAHLSKVRINKSKPPVVQTQRVAKPKPNQKKR
jgi:hypothetical protein